MATTAPVDPGGKETLVVGVSRNLVETLRIIMYPSRGGYWIPGGHIKKYLGAGTGYLEGI